MIKIFMIILFPFFLLADELEPHKKTCEDIGFTIGTEEFAQCVMDFYKQANNQNSTSSNNTGSSDLASKQLEKQNKILQEQLEFDKAYAKEKERLRKFNLWNNFLFPPQQNYQNRNLTCSQRGNTKWIDCY